MRACVCRLAPHWKSHSALWIPLHWYRNEGPCVLPRLTDLTLFPEFSRAVAGRPAYYAAVLRMKQDGSSSSSLGYRGRPRQDRRTGSPADSDWPGHSRHHTSGLGTRGSQEDPGSEGGRFLLIGHAVDVFALSHVLSDAGGDACGWSLVLFWDLTHETLMLFWVQNPIIHILSFLAIPVGSWKEQANIGFRHCKHIFLGGWMCKKKLKKKIKNQDNSSPQ